ncbi:MULE domain-containing protein [Trichonephila clavata]|uniref:MULE domain-containing protein n=1 Tax=Trichonephila clavata TaxID=2740835 RepID=A0A8X6HV45_TRICU|nr:MULE domain-containing protein [Trichonephila clavata]
MYSYWLSRSEGNGSEWLTMGVRNLLHGKKKENKTMSKYVRQRGSKTLENGDIMMNYHCCRSGTYKPKGKGVKSLKSQGSAKIGISCPAIIKLDRVLKM